MKKNTKIISQILFVLISYVCNAQSLPPPAADDIPPPPGDALPIDDGIIVLQVLAFALGLFFLYKSYKNFTPKEIKS